MSTIFYIEVLRSGFGFGASALRFYQIANIIAMSISSHKNPLCFVTAVDGAESSRREDVSMGCTQKNG